MNKLRTTLSSAIQLCLIVLSALPVTAQAQTSNKRDARRRPRVIGVQPASPRNPMREASSSTRAASTSPPVVGSGTPGRLTK